MSAYDVLPRGVSRDQLRAALREEARREAAILSLQDFMRAAWCHVEPLRPLKWNWHYSLLCDELEAVSRGESDHLVICEPPGTGKSITVQAFFLAWDLLHNPQRRTLTLSSNPKPITKYAVAMRSLIQSDWYRDLIRRVHEREGLPLWTLRADQNQKINYETTATGARMCGSIGGKVTGDRVDGLLIDDPNDARDVTVGSPTQWAERMAETVALYDDVLASRIDPEVGWRICIMQRLHEDDLAGVLLKRGIRHVVLPMEYLPGDPYTHPRDPRTKAGELLFPARFSRDWCDETKGTTPSSLRMYETQYQQKPTPASGALFKRHYFSRPDRRYTGDPVRFARSLDELAITIDCAFREKPDADYTVMQVWGRSGVRKYLLDQVRGQMDFPEMVDAARALAVKWPAARLKLVEARALGDALIKTLSQKLPGVIGWDPLASKYARAQASALAYESGEIWLPEYEYAPWLSGYIEEHVAFPKGGNDDQVDATSMLIIRWDGPEEPNALERTKKQFAGLGKSRS